MIKLKDVSTKRLIMIYERKSINNQANYYIYNFLKKNNIDNYQKLSDLLEKQKKHYGNIEALNYLETQLKRVQQKIDEANKNNKEVKLYKFNKYKSALLDEKTALITDKETLGNVLLYRNIIYGSSPRTHLIDDISIQELKEELSYLTDQQLNPIFENRINVRSNILPEKIASAINFYEDQVLRQATETSDLEINLFELNKYEKREIVQAEFKKITEYLTDNADELIWGKLTDPQRIRLSQSSADTTNYILVLIKKEIINKISDYTTLTELQKGIIKKKTLDRFIIKKR